jgi:hypothetical protein
MLQRYILLIAALCTLSHCIRPGHHFKSPPGYNLNKPYKLNLPVELDEISGTAFYPRDSSVFAIVDEFGLLYKIPLISGRQIHKWQFAEGADYEELVMIDSVFYVLRSDGTIVSFTFNDSNHIVRHETDFDDQGNEFEALYYDSSIKKLGMICKDCEADRKKSLTGYYFDPHTNVFDSAGFSIRAKKIAEMMNEKKLKFKPSAAAIHPITHKLYIIAAVNSLLVIADLQGNPESAYRLDERLFKQPEGLTFTPEGDMIISNEAADDGVANLLFFKYQTKKP